MIVEHDQASRGPVGRDVEPHHVFAVARRATRARVARQRLLALLVGAVGAVIAWAGALVVGGDPARVAVAASEPASPEDRLRVAIADGDRERVTMLVAAGALEALDAAHPGQAARLAMQRCDVELFRSLTSAGAQRVVDRRIGEDVALTSAIRHCGADEVRDVWADTPSRLAGIRVMTYAAAEGTVEALRALAELGLPLQSAEDPRGSALEAALVAGRTDQMALLIRLGADTRWALGSGMPIGPLLPSRLMP